MKKCCDSEAIQGSLQEQFPHLQVQHPLKLGQLFRCQHCSCHWFLADNQKWFYRLRPEVMTSLDHWNSADLSLDPAMASLLLEIGGVENEYFQTLDFPCSVVTSSGKHYPKALVRRSKLPPDHHVVDKLVWPHQVVSLAPSPLSLPLQLRRDSFATQETSMGFAPLPLTDAAGKAYTLGSPGHFLEGPGYQGNHMRASSQGRGFWGWPNIVQPTAPDCYIYLDP